jgi:peptidoglycan/xylan/chitin deacetylase (PgdA/CDA1 family)
MQAHRITFGAHTVTHPVLSQLTQSRLQEEVAQSKKTIEQKLTKQVRHFAYPFGRSSHFNLAVKDVLRQQGFATAVTTIYGYNAPDHDLLELRRFTPWAHDPARFAMQMDWYRFAGISSPETAGKMAGLHVTEAHAG